jgi:transcriptional regulator with XRE-family HTH domain
LQAVGRSRNTEYIEAFGNHVKSLRLARKLSREVLAAKAEIETMQIYRIENGRTNTTISTLYAIARALEIAPSEMLNFELYDDKSAEE